MIPKKIHFCWLSGEEYPELIKKCLESWSTILPDYEIKLWDTKNFDVDICNYTREAFDARKYAFVSDYVRLYALYNEGGIYLDSDIEVIKRFDDLLNNNAFTCFENDHAVAAWIFGSEKGNPIFKEFLDYYADKHFLNSDGTFDLTPNPIPITNICLLHGLKCDGKTQKLENITVYSQDYFCPYDRKKEIFNITENTYCIHYFNGAWLPDSRRKLMVQRKKVVSQYGQFIGYLFYGYKVLTIYGMSQLWNEIRILVRNIKK